MLALIILPVWIPFSIGLMEERTSLRRKCLNFLMYAGILWSTIIVFALFRSGATVAIEKCHILYTIQEEFYGPLFALVCYALIAIPPFFISRNRLINILGILVALSCGISYYVWEQHLISLWCFFAALISLGIYFVVASDRNKALL